MSKVFPATGMPDADWWRALWPDPERLIAELGISADMRVVDLCCGDGLFTLAIARQAAHVVAIDLDPVMLDRSRARLSGAGVGNCEIVEGDAYDVAKLVDQAADIVVMANTFHGVPDKPRLAQAVAAVLKPGGRFILINWHRRPREETTVFGHPRGPTTEMRMEPDDVTAVTAPGGFELARVIELPPYHYAAILVKPALLPSNNGERHGK